MNKIILFVICFLIACNAYASCPSTPADCYTVVTCTEGETGTCRETIDCSLAAVQAAIDASSASDGTVYGDGVYLPTGDVAWASHADIASKHGIVIKGNGTSNTELAAEDAIFSANGTNKLRITGIRFNTSAGDSPIQIKGVNNRIDHNLFAGESNISVYFLGGTVHNTGVVDNNDFGTAIISYSANKTVYVEGPDSGGMDFDDVVSFGASSFVFVEDNTVYSSANGPEMFETQYGGKLVVRHNVVSDNGSTNSATFLEQHNSANAAGGRALVAYENTFYLNNEGISRVLYYRSGTGLIYDNIFDYSGRSAGEPETWFHLQTYRAGGGETHEDTGVHDCATDANVANVSAESVCTDCLSRCCSSSYTDSGYTGEGYPCVTGIGTGVYGGTHEPIYFWGNTRTANGVDYVSLDSNDITVYSDVAWAIQNNRDYCVAETDQPASCGGVALTYAPYTYPHPLRDEAAQPSASGITFSGVTIGQ
jgi:hypothetical protein